MTDGRATPSLWLELTPNCNLRCVFCYNPWRDGPKSAFPSRQTYAALQSGVDRLLRAVRFRYVALSGGEPLLYPSLMELVSWLSDRGESLVLTTNGRLLSQARAEELRDAGLGTVQISLLGSNSRTHDALAGRPSFDQALRAMACARSAGLATSTTFIATSSNIRELPRVVKLVGLLGQTELVVNELHPVGSAADEMDTLGISTRQFERALHAARRVGATTDVDVVPVRAASASTGGPVVARGWRRWSVSPDGCIKLCNHSSRTVGSLAEMTDDQINWLALALDEGRYEELSRDVDNCLCFTRAVQTRVTSHACAPLS